MAALGLLAVKTIHPFLAVNDPVIGGVLAVEGWAPDYVLVAAQNEFTNHHYAKLCVTGGPLEVGAPLSQYQTYAELGTAVLLKLGMATNQVVAVPAPYVRQDRTYTAARALKDWLRKNAGAVTGVHVITVGAHSRRSRLLYAKALGKGYTVGMTAVPDRNYDELHWWRSSQGFRNVTGEVIAYVYARLFFWPRTVVN